MMKKYTFLCCFVVLIFTYISTTHAQEFAPPVILEPPIPVDGEPFSIGLFISTYPPCLIVPQVNQQGESSLLEVDGQDLEFYFVTETEAICNPIPFDPPPRFFYEIDGLEAGMYTLTTFGVGITTPLPVPPMDFFPFQFGPEIVFEIRQGEPPVSSTPSIVPSLSILSTIFLIIAFFVTLAFFYKLNKE